MQERVLITGGTGLVGRFLTEVLVSKGFKVAVLSRSPKTNTQNISYYLWDVYKGMIDPACLENVTTIFHLAGENVAAKSWSSKRKREILDSRVMATQLLQQALANNTHQVKTFVSASAVGYYGSTTSSIVFDETQKPGNDFLAEVCVAWEKAIFAIEDIGIRAVALRTGLVLSNKGGALQKMLLPFKLGLGAAMGNGKQFVPWVHISDLCQMYIFAMENNEIQGVYNAVVNDALSNESLSRNIARILARPYLGIKIPKIFLEAILGEMAVILLEGSRVSSQKIMDAGFEFEHPKILLALDDLLR